MGGGLTGKAEMLPYANPYPRGDHTALLQRSKAPAPQKVGVLLSGPFWAIPSHPVPALPRG
jgi:hypothetical protein